MKILQPILYFFFTSLYIYADLSAFAAASTTDVLKELAAVYKEDHGESLRFNFASSGALARQIEAGAPADIFVSANLKWMDWLEQKESIKKSTRFNLAANTLVLAANNQHNELRITNKESQHLEGTQTLPHSKFLNQNSEVPSGYVAVGDFKSVPAGIYAKEALTYMGWLENWKQNLVQSSNVRTALLYVQRGEVAAGIVYSTDAKAAGLPIIGTFPPESHSPIVYPVAACSEKGSALQFLEFLKSDKAKAILKKHGFTILEENTKHQDTKVSKQAGLKEYRSLCPSCLCG